MASGQTLRVRKLPKRTTEEDIKEFFNARLNPSSKDLIVQRIGTLHLVSNPATIQATVTFRTRSWAEKAKELSVCVFRTSDGITSKIEIDDDFLGLTVLYSPSEEEPNLNVIAVHGLGGHAYNSFTSTRTKTTSKDDEEFMWLCDLLPHTLERHSIFPRVMVYGYRPDLWTKDFKTGHHITEHSEVEALTAVVRSNSTAPLLFIAHNPGGILVKLTMLDIMPERANDMFSSDLIPGCVFFGTPHQTRPAKSLLAALNVWSKGTTGIQKKKITQQLEEVLNIVNPSFANICTEHKIRALNCFETNEVVLHTTHPVLLPVEALHRYMVRVDSVKESNLFPIFEEMIDLAKTLVNGSTNRAIGLKSEATSSTSSRPGGASFVMTVARPAILTDSLGTVRLKNLYDLAHFNTVIIVDDLVYMSNKQWLRVRDLLMILVGVVAKYNKRGVAIHFLNNEPQDMERLTDPQLIPRTLLCTIPPPPVPRYRYHEELTDHIRRYWDPRRRVLNMIFLSDEFPHNQHDLDDIIFSCSRKVVDFDLKAEQGLSLQFVRTSHRFISDSSSKGLDILMNNDRPAYLEMYQNIHIVRWEPEFSDEFLDRVLLGGGRQMHNQEAYDEGRRLAQAAQHRVLEAEIAETKSGAQSTDKPNAIREVLLRTVSTSYPDQFTAGQSLLRIVTLTDTAENAQAATCVEYIREFWPQVGTSVLSAIDQALRSHNLNEGEITSVAISAEELASQESSVALKNITIRLHPQSTKLDDPYRGTTITVEGSLECQADVAEILSWLTAAIRSSDRIELSKSRAQFVFEGYGPINMVTYFSIYPEKLQVIEHDVNMCWHPLFVNTVIAVQFPITPRTEGVGVELSPVLMATLAGSRSAVDYHGGLILRGLYTALIPLEKLDHDNAIQWHLVVMDSSKEALKPGLFAEIEQHNIKCYKTQDVQSFWGMKAYLGWCKAVKILLGTNEADYSRISWSEPSQKQKMIDLTGFSVGIASGGMGILGPSATADFAIARNSRPRFMNIEQQLGDRLKLSIAKPLVVYDTSDSRAWMVPIVCLILHMMHLRLRELQRHFEISDEQEQTVMPFSKITGEAGRQAYDVLIEYMNPQRMSSLGSSRVWNDTIARFYIALDKALEEALKMSDKPSFPLSQNSRICGFELMDIVCADSLFRFNQRSIQKESGGWGSIVEHVGCVVFCSGLGDAMVPATDTMNLCDTWSRMPPNHDYLGAYVPCLIEMLTRQGKHESTQRLTERALKDDLYRDCQHGESSRCFHLQIYSEILNPSHKAGNAIIGSSDHAIHIADHETSAHQGAIVFGKITRLFKDFPAGSASRRTCTKKVARTV